MSDINSANSVEKTSEHPKFEINNYHIDYNHDGTYCVEIASNVQTTVYPRAKVLFGISDSIVFPISFVVLNKDDEQVFNYTLNLKHDQVADKTDEMTNIENNNE